MANITARMLAEELLKNPDDIVCVVSDNFELNGAIIPKTSPHLYRFHGRIVSETFRDAFDGGTYNSDVVMYDEEGDLSFIQV